jgi:hypothetical protein
MDQHSTFDYTPEQNGQHEVLFENTHIRNKAFWKEFYTYAFFKRPFFIVCYIALALIFVVSLQMFFTHDDFSIIVLMLPPLCLLFVVFIAVYSARLANKRETENGNGNPIVYTTEITSDTVRLQSSLGTNQEITLATVKRVVQTKHYLMLRTPTAQLYPIKKDGFTKGNYQDLCAHLRAKGLKVKTK